MLEQETNLKTSGFTRFCFHFSFTYPNVSVLLSLEREGVVFLFFLFVFVFLTRCLTSSAQFMTGSTYLSVNVKKRLNPDSLVSYSFMFS